MFYFECVGNSLAVKIGVCLYFLLIFIHLCGMILLVWHQLFGPLKYSLQQFAGISPNVN